MVYGRKVYNPLNDEWSTGWWYSVTDINGNIVNWLPVWRG